MRRAIVRGTGHYLPERVVENSWFEDKLDTSDEWIRARTGIERRHFAAEDQGTSDLAIRAAQAALADAGIEAGQIDAVIVATSTPDLTFPSVATMVQAGLGMRRGFAYDLQAVCAGFVYALANADAMIRAGLADRVLLIGAETFSRIMDWSDRSTCVLFGDGAGAMVLEAAEGQGTSADRGILATDLNSDGQYRDLLYVDGGVASTGTAGHLRMQGNLVFRHAVEKLADTAHRALDRASLTPEQVDWLVPHQANLRIIEATAKRMHLPMEKVVLTVADHGNTSAASIPLALSVANAEGRFKPGDVLVAEAIGGGLAWGSVVLRW
ncbi:beta-ketoacyl-ACP synthase III [Paracoccus sp. P2]|uniref:Beta-ketoacyl-[acyl-carrier-protein] synthase III n=1 Tax=Paracoccus pantotrophus TaxID=82367 RepID=A0A1I5C8H8_PARPN|nr:beta-ketoacyl-ACP synthase III [Paracoccus pantotrophus]MDF3853005.1 ketoacyl-ACP synthase III [Paracoccus pantotrophus]QFG35635.1 ketoacyl-ACP synthase III [Paracoccus pantotrophus]QLH13908.1 ketoacyl-ACP synthase III [Paracoccus pantotrophus]RDE01004.1 ketoacyl-ACP synthase III [Paracoccus pantotrophus]RKS44124.1 3-oxoacyl-[acyl-carrier-protein] synthase III [Paracoccus pantotrophus]